MNDWPTLWGIIYNKVYIILKLPCNLSNSHPKTTNQICVILFSLVFNFFGGLILIKKFQYFCLTEWSILAIRVSRLSVVLVYREYVLKYGFLVHSRPVPVFSPPDSVGLVFTLIVVLSVFFLLLFFYISPLQNSPGYIR